MQPLDRGNLSMPRIENFNYEHRSTGIPEIQEDTSMVESKGFQCALMAIPTTQADDDNVRITRWDFKRGAATGWHKHEWPYFVVMLTDGVMRVYDGTHVTQYARTAGECYARPAGVIHDVMNGETFMAFIQIEIKRSEALCFLPAVTVTGSDAAP